MANSAPSKPSPQSMTDDAASVLQPTTATGQPAPRAGYKSWMTPEEIVERAQSDALRGYVPLRNYFFEGKDLEIYLAERRKTELAMARRAGAHHHAYKWARAKYADPAMQAEYDAGWAEDVALEKALAEQAALKAQQTPVQPYVGIGMS